MSALTSKYPIKKMKSNLRSVSKAILTREGPTESKESLKYAVKHVFDNSSIPKRYNL